MPQGSVVGPLFFNIFLNDLFYFVTKVQLSAYADDQQIYSSDTDHAALYERMNGELAVAVDCFRQNGLMANPDKFQALILGSTNLDFTFVVGDHQTEVHRDIDLLGINIDCDLKFHKYISKIFDSANKQLQVIRRFRNLISNKTKVRLYKAFVLPIFQYCSSVWHFCGARNRDKLELLNKQVLRVVLNGSSSSYERSLSKVKMTSLQDMLILVYVFSRYGSSISIFLF